MRKKPGKAYIPISIPTNILLYGMSRLLEMGEGELVEALIARFGLEHYSGMAENVNKEKENAITLAATHWKLRRVPDATR